MDKLKKKPNILFFKGINRADLAVLRPNQFNGSIKMPEKPIEPPRLYTALPTQFVSPEQWPKHSDLACWNCALTFKTYPKFIPTEPSNYSTWGSRPIYKYVPLGNFCSWECAARYINVEVSPEMRKDYYEMLCDVRTMFTPSTANDTKSSSQISIIAQAPSKTIMTRYRGDLTGISEEQYVKQLANLQAIYRSK
jgi:hypothetical protein